MNRRKFVKSALLIAPLSLLSENQKRERRTRRTINFKGKILVNGKPFDRSQKIQVNDTVQTVGKDSYAKFSIGEDAFKLSRNAIVTLEGNEKVDSIDVKSGRLLAVFKTGRDRTITTSNATMGIRGTAVFVEAESKKKTKFCTCYGKTTVSDKSNKNSTRELQATHHKSVEIVDGNVDNTNIFYGLGQFLFEPTHSDKELRELESMVGRIPAFDRNGKRPFIEL